MAYEITFPISTFYTMYRSTFFITNLISASWELPVIPVYPNSLKTMITPYRGCKVTGLHRNGRAHQQTDYDMFEYALPLWCQYT